MATLRAEQTRREGLRSLGAVIVVSIALAATIMVGLPGTTALFTADYPDANDVAASRIFRDERITTAFDVNDVSSGSASNQSSATAFAADSRYFLSRVWPVAFDSARYLDLELNTPLPAGLAASSVALDLRVSSDLGTGSVCFYVEVRRVSNNALLSSHGSTGTPLSCTSGSSVTTLNVNLSAVTTTDLANDLRVRIFARDSSAGGMRVDQGSVSGSSPYATFTLYPILTREAYSGLTETLRWGLSGT